LDCFIAVLIHGGSHWKFSNLPSQSLGSGFKHFSFLPGEMIQFDWRIFFQNGWEKTPTRFLYFHVPPKKVAENRGKFVSETNCEQKMWGIPC